MIDGRSHLKLAEALAPVMHEGQLRKGTGEPYHWHVERVARRVVGWKAKTIALLHDLVEDTEVTLDDLRRLRFPEDVVLAVDALSRREHDGETYFEFIERGIATGSNEALLVKLADLQDNLHDDLDEGAARVAAGPVHQGRPDGAVGAAPPRGARLVAGVAQVWLTEKEIDALLRAAFDTKVKVSSSLEGPLRDKLVGALSGVACPAAVRRHDPTEDGGW